MDVFRMRDILTPHLSQIREYVYMNSELAMVRGEARLKSTSTCKTATSRAAHSFISVQAPSSIPSTCQPTSASSAWDYFPTSPCPLRRDRCHRPSTVRYATSSYPSAKRISLLLNIFWTLSGKWFMPPTTIIVPLFHQQADQLASSRSREQTIFDRFLQLVTQHCAEHHQIGYYADRMCLTERYLTTVIRQTSGTTAKDWIDRALITRIKIELRHTDKSAAQIADEMHFANPSFFSKYFRRLTGMTPGEYKRV